MHYNIPQNLKYRKYNKKFKFNVRHFEHRVCYLLVGSSCGLVALESGYLNLKQLQTCFKLLHKTIKAKKRRNMKVLSSIIIRAPLTMKSLGSRMGRGKGGVKDWMCFFGPGRVLFQIQWIRNVKKAVLALRKIQYKLPMLTKIVLRYPSNFRKYLLKKR